MKIPKEAKIAMKHYLDQGLTPFQAAAIVGGFIVESNLKTKALGDRNLREQAHGIGQWRGRRWELLQDYAKAHNTSHHDFLTQLDFALSELSTTERMPAGDTLFHSKTLEDAVDAMVHYERPAGWTKHSPRKAHTWKQRLNTAKAVLIDWTAA